MSVVFRKEDDVAYDVNLWNVLDIPLNAYRKRLLDDLHISKLLHFFARLLRDADAITEILPEDPVLKLLLLTVPLPGAPATNPRPFQELAWSYIHALFQVHTTTHSHLSLMLMIPTM